MPLARMTVLVLAIIVACSANIIAMMPVYGQETTPPEQQPPASSDVPIQSIGAPYVFDDPEFTVQKYAGGLRFPTSMAFLGQNDILVLEKNDGTVRRIINGSLLPDPLLDVNVGNLDERGMLGIAVSENEQLGVTYVFVYFTEMSDRDGSDVNGTIPVGNRLYRYELSEGKLVNGKMLLDLPAKFTDNHNGGKLIIGPDDNLYLTVGDQQEPGQGEFTHITTTQNQDGAAYPDGTGGILRITQDGKPAQNLFGGKYPIDLYYAYGIRNSFGIDFDPVTGKLWDTENGPDLKDEINLVEPGFNGGWRQLQGLADNDSDLSKLVEFPGLSVPKDSLIGRAEALSYEAQGLGGKYSDPEFVWQKPIVPTAIQFWDSEELPGRYENDLFVASFQSGEIYNFNLNEDRTALALSGPLEDKVEHNHEGYDGIKFARNFGAITDIKVGPDGYLYVITFFSGEVYRILSVEDAANSSIPEFPIQIMMVLVVPSAFAAMILLRRFFSSTNSALTP